MLGRSHASQESFTYGSFAKSKLNRTALASSSDEAVDDAATEGESKGLGWEGSFLARRTLQKQASLGNLEGIHCEESGGVDVVVAERK